MKKLIALLLALCLTAAMFGCGTITPEANTTGATSISTNTPTTTAPIEYPSLTVPDEDIVAVRDDIIATVGDRELTNAEFNVCYWMGVYSFLNNYGNYISYLGLDLTQPLDKQAPSSDTSRSWQEFFVEDALAAWHVYQATALVAQEKGIEMPTYLKEDLDGLMDLMAESAEKGGYESADAMIQKDAGAAASAEAYYTYTLHYYEYLACIEYLEQTTGTTDADIEKYFTDHKEELSEEGITKDSGNVYGVRHILISPKGGTTDDSGNTTYSDAEWEACRVEAQKLMDEWAGGTATEETFSHYAQEYSTDPGSKDNGGLYDGLDKDTSFVEPFKNWYLEEGRKVGDYGLVKTDYGYHIMYMSSIEAKWISHCRDAILNDAVDTFIKDAQEKYPIETNEDKIALGEVQLSSES